MPPPPNRLLRRLSRPRAITMWDFSWLERRWPGAGYEDVGLALDELAERGYDAVRIDAYPHLVAAGPEQEWELPPCWNTQDWGSPALNRVRVQPALNDFLAACAARGILVGLSTWYRADRTERRLHILSPEEQADQWAATLRSIPPALHSTLLYVDLCNEWPLDCWAPFFRPTAGHREGDWASTASLEWIGRATARLRAHFPDLPLTFSTTSEPKAYAVTSPPGCDCLEVHAWMANLTDFYPRLGYSYDRFSPSGYEKIVRHAESLYRHQPAHWQQALRDWIEFFARCGRDRGLPLVTTECWAVVDYKDGPLLDWGWVRELTALGTEIAVATGAWAAVATSNFCGPQFRGMWRDVGWHRRLTDRIKAGRLPADCGGPA